MGLCQEENIPLPGIEKSRETLENKGFFLKLILAISELPQYT